MNSLFSKLQVFLFGIFMLCLIGVIDSIPVIVTLVYFYTGIIVFLYAKKGVADPRVFPLAFMSVYFTFFPLRAYLYGSENLPFDEGVLILSLRLQFIAMLIFVAVSNLLISNVRQVEISTFCSQQVRSTSSERLLFVFMLPFVFYSLVIILTSDATSKREVLDSFSSVKTISDFSILILTVLVFLRAARIGRFFYKDLFLMLYLVFCVFYVLLTGERDSLFKLLFGFMIIYYDRRGNFNFLKMIAIFGALLFVVPVSQYFKSVLLSGTVNFDRFGGDLILYSEFMSSSRNFYSLLVFDAGQNISFLLSDVVRAFVPTALLGDYGMQSTVAWFDRVFRPEHGFDGTSGWGFTIVGFGYIVGGLAGIVLIMAFYAWLLAFLYNRRWRSLYWYAFYILALAAFVYALRADLANLLSQVFKISGLCVLFVFMAHYLLRRPSGSGDLNKGQL